MIVQFRSRRNLINREWCMEEALDIALSTGYCLTRIYFIILLASLFIVFCFNIIKSRIL